MEQAVTTEGAEAACRVLEGTLTKEQVEALEERERRLYGDGGDVKASLAPSGRSWTARAGGGCCPATSAASSRSRPRCWGSASTATWTSTFAFTPHKPGASTSSGTCWRPTRRRVGNG